MSDTVWRARTLLTSPHRLCFFWGGVQWVASALWWFAVLLREPPQQRFIVRCVRCFHG